MVFTRGHQPLVTFPLLISANKSALLALISVPALLGGASWGDWTAGGGGGGGPAEGAGAPLSTVPYKREFQCLFNGSQHIKLKISGSPAHFPFTVESLNADTPLCSRPVQWCEKTWRRLADLVWCQRKLVPMTLGPYSKPVNIETLDTCTTNQYYWVANLLILALKLFDNSVAIEQGLIPTFLHIRSWFRGYSYPAYTPYTFLQGHQVIKSLARTSGFTILNHSIYFACQVFDDIFQYILCDKPRIARFIQHNAGNGLTGEGHLCLDASIRIFLSSWNASPTSLLYSIWYTIGHNYMGLVLLWA